MSDTPKPGTPLPWRKTKRSFADLPWVLHDSEGHFICACSLEQEAEEIIELQSKLAELEKPCRWTGRRIDEDGQELAKAGCSYGLVPWNRFHEFCPYCGHPITEESEA